MNSLLSLLVRLLLIMFWIKQPQFISIRLVILYNETIYFVSVHTGKDGRDGLPGKYTRI